MLLYYRLGLPACTSERQVLLLLVDRLTSRDRREGRRRRDRLGTLFDCAPLERLRCLRHHLAQALDEVLLTLDLIGIRLTRTVLVETDREELVGVDTSATAVVLADRTDEGLTLRRDRQGQAVDAHQLDLLGLAALDADLADHLHGEVGVNAVVLTNLIGGREGANDTELDTICKSAIEVHFISNNW